MSKIYFITNSETADLEDTFQGRKYPQLSLIKPPLEDMGFTVKSIVWGTSIDQLSPKDLLILGTVWGYTQHIYEFCSWLNVLENNGFKLYNSFEFIRWNLDKKYLFDLDKNGIRILPVFLMEKGAPLSTFINKIENTGWKQFILKSTIDAGGFTFRYADNLTEGIKYYKQMSKQHALLVQPFIPEISKQGELSFVFF